MIFGFTDCTGGAGAIIFHSEFFHDPLEVQKNIAQLIYQFRSNPAGGIGIFAQLHSMADMIGHTDSLSGRKLIDFQIYLITSHINRSKHRACHNQLPPHPAYCLPVLPNPPRSSADSVSVSSKTISG